MGCLGGPVDDSCLKPSLLHYCHHESEGCCGAKLKGFFNKPCNFADTTDYWYYLYINHYCTKKRNKDYYSKTDIMTNDYQLKPV